MIEDIQNLEPEYLAILYADDALEPDEVAFAEAKLQKYPDLLAKVEKMREFNSNLIETIGLPLPCLLPEPEPPSAKERDGGDFMEAVFQRHPELLAKFDEIQKKPDLPVKGSVNSAAVTEEVQKTMDSCNDEFFCHSVGEHVNSDAVTEEKLLEFFNDEFLERFRRENSQNETISELRAMIQTMGAKESDRVLCIATSYIHRLIYKMCRLACRSDLLPKTLESLYNHPDIVSKILKDVVDAKEMVSDFKSGSAED